MRVAYTFFVLASLVVSGFSTTTADVQADIATIKTQLTTLDNSINAFSLTSGNLLQALAIHTNSEALTPTINQGTSDTEAVSPSPVSEADGRAILTAVEALEPIIDDALSGIVARKAAFTALPLGGVPALVKQDLATLSTATAAFEAALIAAAPADLVSEATALKSRIDAAFATAIAAYA